MFDSFSLCQAAIARFGLEFLSQLIRSSGLSIQWIQRHRKSVKNRGNIVEIKRKWWEIMENNGKRILKNNENKSGITEPSGQQ
jgi:hypothetical protein